MHIQLFIPITTKQSKYIKTIKKLRPKQTTYHTRSTELTKMCPRKNHHSPPQTSISTTSVVPGTLPSPRTTCLNGHLSNLQWVYSMHIISGLTVGTNV